MEERWSRRVGRIKHGDSPVFSLPVRAGSAHCLLSGVALFPVVPNSVAGAREPFLVAAKGFQVPSGVMLDTVPSWMVERFEQSGSRQHRDVMRFETEKPSGLTNEIALINRTIIRLFTLLHTFDERKRDQRLSSAST